MKQNEEEEDDYNAQQFISHNENIAVEANKRELVTTVEQVRGKWTFSPTSKWYRAWTIAVTLSCLISTILYPMASVNHFPDFWTLEFFIIMFCEFIFLIDIILNFFK